jgi:[DsrC]-trisulfide reductase subunit J
MTSRMRVGLGLGAFLLLGAYPAWNALASGVQAERPALERARDSVAVTGCLEDTTWMKAHHQALLNQWRTAVVRDGKRTWESSTGRSWDMSLTGTCLKCHTNTETFCTRCHDYADVQPTCWSCHVVPQGGQSDG